MKRATVRTRHAEAELIANSVRPDNTDEMTMTVDDDAIETTLERETTGGLRTTVDDYIVNLQVAAAIKQRRNETTTTDDTKEGHQ